MLAAVKRFAHAGGPNIQCSQHGHACHALRAAWQAFSWYGFNDGSTMLGGLWGGAHTQVGDFATVVYRAQLLGFNAVRLPFRCGTLRTLPYPTHLVCISAWPPDGIIWLIHLRVGSCLLDQHGLLAGAPTVPHLIQYLCRCGPSWLTSCARNSRTRRRSNGVAGTGVTELTRLSGVQVL